MDESIIVFDVRAVIPALSCDPSRKRRLTLALELCSSSLLYTLHPHPRLSIHRKLVADSRRTTTSRSPNTTALVLPNAGVD